MGLVQGVGQISKVFLEIQTQFSNRALSFVPGTPLCALERTIAAAFCNVLVPTRQLQHPSVAVLKPLFLQHMQQLRSWLLAVRQEEGSAGLEQVEKRALLLCKFEPSSTTVMHDTAQQRKMKELQLPSSNSGGSSKESTRQWRKMFAAWKAMKQLKTLMALIQ